MSTGAGWVWLPPTITRHKVSASSPSQKRGHQEQGGPPGTKGTWDSGKKVPREWLALDTYSLLTFPKKRASWLPEHSPIHTEYNDLVSRKNTSPLPSYPSQQQPNEITFLPTETHFLIIFNQWDPGGKVLSPSSRFRFLGIPHFWPHGKKLGEGASGHLLAPGQTLNDSCQQEKTDTLHLLLCGHGIHITGRRAYRSFHKLNGSFWLFCDVGQNEPISPPSW